MESFKKLYKEIIDKELLESIRSTQYILNEKNKEGFSDKEAKKLIKRYKDKDDVKARNELVIGYLPLVTKVVSKNYAGLKSVGWEDLQQIGAMALMKAIDSFDPDHGSKFMSWAWQYIDGYIKNNQWKKDNLHSSIDIPISSKDGGGGDSSTYLDLISKDSKEDSSYKAVEDDDNYKQLAKAIGKLKPKMQNILNLYFGLTQEKMTLQEIGDKLGMSPQGVKKNIDNALPKLKKYIKLD